MLRKIFSLSIIFFVANTLSNTIDDWPSDSSDCNTAIKKLFQEVTKDYLKDFDSQFNKGSFNTLFQNMKEQLTSNQMNAINENILNDLPQLRNEVSSFEEVSFSLSEASALRETIEKHPVAGLHRLSDYDPLEQIHFCFGRAHASYLECMRQDYPSDAFMKIWVVGEMTTQKGKNVTHHVAFLVPTNKTPSGWWVIDSRLPSPVSPKTWYKYWEQELTGDRLLLLSTPQRIMATAMNQESERKIMRRSVEHPLAKIRLGEYFKDLYQSYLRDLPKLTPVIGGGS